MSELREILDAIKEVKSEVVDMRIERAADHATNVAEHKSMAKDVSGTLKHLEKLNGRVGVLEHFKTSLKTRQILVPTAISLFIGGAGLALKFM